MTSIADELREIHENIATLIAAKDEKDANGETERYHELKRNAWGNVRRAEKVLPGLAERVAELEQQIETWRVEHRVKTAYKLFYGDGLSLGEVAEQLHCSIYDLSPWLTAAATRMALDAALPQPPAESEGE
ncbi:MAG: hypothetical protein BGO49_24680 [Planctomycetales bacterium 71-10]|nr:MAG: hypothetical protein BGO49_24680 [Planctomycetales bacterium 71-10]